MDKRAFRMEVKELEAETGTFTGYLSVFGNEDAQGDVVERGAFKRTLDKWRRKARPIPLLWQHQEVIGGIEPRDAVEDDHGLLVKGKLVMELQKAREVLALMRANVVNAMSIGYDVIQQARDGTVRRLKELRLYEGSLVLWPANEQAEVLVVKNVSPGEAKQMEVQSVIFPKKHWDDVADCKQWLKDHDFKSSDVDETSTSWRFRQRDPGDFSRMRTVCLTPRGTAPGPDCRIEAIVGMPKSDEAEATKEAIDGDVEMLAAVVAGIKERFSEASNTTPLSQPVTVTVTDSDGGNYTYTTDSITFSTDSTTGPAISEATKAGIRDAADELLALLGMGSATDGAASTDLGPGKQNGASDSGDDHSDDAELQELAKAVRGLAEKLTRRDR